MSHVPRLASNAVPPVLFLLHGQACAGYSVEDPTPGPLPFTLAGMSACWATLGPTDSF